MTLTYYISNIIITVTIKDASLKQPIQGFKKEQNSKETNV